MQTLAIFPFIIENNDEHNGYYAILSIGTPCRTKIGPAESLEMLELDMWTATEHILFSSEVQKKQNKDITLTVMHPNRDCRDDLGRLNIPHLNLGDDLFLLEKEQLEKISNDFGTWISQV